MFSPFENAFTKSLCCSVSGFQGSARAASCTVVLPVYFFSPFTVSARRLASDGAFRAGIREGMVLTILRTNVEKPPGGGLQGAGRAQVAKSPSPAAAMAALLASIEATMASTLAWTSADSTVPEARSRTWVSMPVT